MRPQRSRLRWPSLRQSAAVCRAGSVLAALAVLAGFTGRATAAEDFGRTPVPVVQPAAEYFVAPDGRDGDPGTRARPFATLGRARDALRARLATGAAPQGGIAITLLPGVYPVTETIRWTAAEGGRASCPVVIRAAQPDTVVFTGGRQVGPFTPVTDPAIRARLLPEARDRVQQASLRDAGITDFGTLQVRGFAQPAAAPTLEVFCNGLPLTPARWPNSGFIRIQRLVEAGSRSAGTPTVFAVDDDRLARWTHAPDAWLFGYFRYLWADASIPVGRVDPAARTIATAQAYEYPGTGPASDAFGGIRFYVYNLLEEIDAPGEWYLDRATGLLYVCDPGDLAHARFDVSVLAAPLFAAQGVSHLRLEGLQFDLGRDTGVLLQDCSDCLIVGCQVSRMAGNGIDVHGGHDVMVHSCNLHYLGRRGIELIGGDRTTLAPGRHLVENCRVHDIGRLDRTYVPAVQVESVGQRVAHNEFFRCPSTAVHLDGNDHVIEWNDVHDAVLESDDQGAMETFGNPTYQGLVFRHNLFRDIGPQGQVAAAFAGRAGIRLDDVISGVEIRDNIFVRAAYGAFGAVQINSGRDNVIAHNLFIDCAECVSGGWEEGNELWKKLRDQPGPEFILNDLYRRRYPLVAQLLEPPFRNEVRDNLAYRCGGAWTATGATVRPHVVPPAWARLDRWRLTANQVCPETEPLVTNDGVRLHLDAAVLARLGFTLPPVEEIGTYRNAYRRP